LDIHWAAVRKKGKTLRTLKQRFSFAGLTHILQLKRKGDIQFDPTVTLEGRKTGKKAKLWGGGR